MHDRPAEAVTLDQEARQPASDEDIRALVTRLSRPHPSGGEVIERAAILAEGADSSAILTWIAAHAGEAEELPPLASGRGLHSGRGEDVRAPRRYVFPAGVLSGRGVQPED